MRFDWLHPSQDTLDYVFKYCEVILIVLAIAWVAKKLVTGGFDSTMRQVATSSVSV